VCTQINENMNSVSMSVRLRLAKFSETLVMFTIVIVSLGWLWLAPFVDAKVGFFFDTYTIVHEHFTQTDHSTWNERFGG